MEVSNVISPDRLSSLLSTKRLVICVGSGGVGKTTTAASLALKAALNGMRSLVITIDPARRLANSMGLSEIGNTETEIPLKKFVPTMAIGGSCSAMMLDTKSAFDDLIRTMAPNHDVYQKIISNRVYQIMSEALAGSREYVATEKLYDFWRSNKYDLIILDTPPMKNALDFLEATGKLGRFLDDRVLRWFLEPYQKRGARGGDVHKHLTGTGKMVFKMLSYVFGEQFLEELYEFFLCFADMFEAVRIRTDEVAKILRSPQTTFLVIAAPREQVLEEARHFQRELSKRGLPLGGFIINQAVVWTDENEEALNKLKAIGENEIHSFVKVALERERNKAFGDAQMIERVFAHHSRQEILSFVPKLIEDIHDIDGLLSLHRYLFRTA